MPRRPGVDQGRLALGRTDQDRISLADVENLDRDRLAPKHAGRAARSPVAAGQKRQRDKAEGEELACRLLRHSLISPPGSRFARSSCTCLVSFASLAVARGIDLERKREHVAGLGAGGQQRLGYVQGRAVVGHENGDLFALSFETVEREPRRHRSRSFGPPGSLDDDGTIGIGSDLRRAGRPAFAQVAHAAGC